MKRAKKITSKIMSCIKSHNTKPEILFRKALWNKNIRFRIKSKVFGKPDIVISKYKIAIFIDGDFWHGNNWKLRNLKSLDAELSSYTKFWQKKILNNITRDKFVNRILKKDGWLIIRFWSSKIETNIDHCVKKTINLLNKRKYGI